MRLEHNTWLTFALCVELNLCETSADVGEFSVRPIAIGMQPREHFLDGQRRKSSIDRQFRLTIFLDTTEISFTALSPIELWIGASHPLGRHLIHCVDFAAQ